MARRDEAQKAARREKTWRSETRVCPICGTSFNPHVSHQITCSKACGMAWNSRTTSAARRAARPQAAAKCAWCGKEFTPRNCRQRFCSSECHEGAKRKRNRDRYAPKASGAGLTNLQIARVKADMELPPSERYAASKEWTPAMHTYARKLYENHNGLFSAYRPSAGFNS